MRLSQWAPSATSVVLTLPFLTSALLLDCNNIQVRGQKYNLKPLEGSHYVSWVREEDGTRIQKNTTFGLNICKQLDMSEAKAKHRCQKGTYVCGIEEEVDLDTDDKITHTPINIAGNYALNAGRPLSPEWSRIQDSGSNADRGKKGLRLELNGGKQPFDDRKGDKQQAIIEFVCDMDRTGLEDEDPDSPKKWPSLMRRDDDDDDDDDPVGSAPGCDDSQGNKSLNFCSYEREDKRLEVLRLMWRTKYACEGMSEDADQDSGGSHWGFFTWLIVIIFLGVAGYLIFGSWLNYSRYGARGWDLIPHGETIRDIPYIVKDFGRNISNAVTSGGSRGGYSAV